MFVVNKVFCVTFKKSTIPYTHVLSILILMQTQIIVLVSMATNTASTQIIIFSNYYCSIMFSPGCCYTPLLFLKCVDMKLYAVIAKCKRFLVYT